MTPIVLSTEQGTQEGQQPALNTEVVLPAFARHYGFEPSVGRPGHKERRGKIERPFRYLEEDFLRARTFAEHAEADIEHSQRQAALCAK